MISEPKVSICIPAYQAEEFIQRTIDCARNQTYENLEILISVDLSSDHTADICFKNAAADARIKVKTQESGLGWSGNTNAALKMASSEFYFVYFHDDVIEPTYVECLLQALLSQPDAASVHCDLLEFGLVDELRPAHEYSGSTLYRLIDFMMTRRGTTLRSIMRRSMTGDDMYFPGIHGDNHWTAYAFHLKLVAAGKAIGVHKPLYRRWQRENSMTRSANWQPPSIQDLMQGQQESFSSCATLFNQVLTDSAHIEIASKALTQFHRFFVRLQQRRLGNNESIAAQLPWQPGWYENLPLDENLLELLRLGENELTSLEKHFV